MSKIFRLGFVVFLSWDSLVLAQTKKPVFDGLYKMQWTKKSGCTLNVKQLSQDKLRMELSCQDRGSSGLAFGVLALKNNMAIFRRQVSGLCEITFSFDHQWVEVNQNGMDVYCGFGMGIYADGKYDLIQGKAPTFKYKE